MGESVEDKMGKSAPENPILEVSVSFGKFENDSLSWEKFSTFSPNKYLEEVGKCATPGSVAQKKAYFEEHYKKIAARKSELMDQEKPLGSDSFKSDDQDHGNMIGESNGQCSVEEVKYEVNGICNGAQNDRAEPTTATEGPSSSAEVEIEEKYCEAESAKPCQVEETVQEEAVLTKEEEICSSSQDKKEFPLKLEKGKDKETPKIKEKNVKLDHRSKSHKINTPVKKERKVAEVKVKSASPGIVKSASPGIRTPQSHTPRASKPISTTSAVSSSRTVTKGGLVSSETRTKGPSVRESKKVAPKSLHMSISVEPSESSTAPLSTTRKSLIMERMGDKDIVKRAFKTFQSSYKELGSSSLDQPSTPKQQPSVRTGGMEKKNAKAAPSIVSLRSDVKADKRNEFSKKLEEKSSARETERTRLQTKSKEDREAEVKRLGQSRNFKASPLPGFYHGQKQSKSHLDKNTKNHNHQ